MSGIKQMPLSKWITASLINILKYEEHLFPILPMDKVLLIICILFIAILHIVNKIYTHIYDKLLSIISCVFITEVLLIIFKNALLK